MLAFPPIIFFPNRFFKTPFAGTQCSLKASVQLQESLKRSIFFLQKSHAETHFLYTMGARVISSRAHEDIHLDQKMILGPISAKVGSIASRFSGIEPTLPARALSSWDKTTNVSCNHTTIELTIKQQEQLTILHITTTYFVLMIFTAISHSIRAIHWSVSHGYYPRTLSTILWSTGFLNVSWLLSKRHSYCWQRDKKGGP